MVDISDWTWHHIDNDTESKSVQLGTLICPVQTETTFPLRETCIEGQPDPREDQKTYSIALSYASNNSRSFRRLKPSKLNLFIFTMPALLVGVECPECRVSGSSHWILCNADGGRERPRVEVCFLSSVLVASQEVNHAFQLELHVLNKPG
jgi:hypothetical protein